ncbi:MAG: hypothetical protein ABIJ97_09825 [Bacteroidota bacterium]
MKKLISIILSMVLLACNSQNENQHTETKSFQEQSITEIVENNNSNNTIEDFRSELQPGKTDWNMEDTYTDTLEFIEYKSESDYAFTIFRTREGKMVKLNSNTEIDNYYRNRNFIVTWKVGKYSEAGEGEAVYFKEQVTKLKMLTTSFSFEKFLEEFTADYRKGNQTVIMKYLNPLVPFVSANKPGAYCTMCEPNPEKRVQFTGDDFIITCQKPEGNKCDGFKGAKDGLYYEFIGETQLPSFFNMSEYGSDISPTINEDVEYYYYVNVLVIKDGAYSRTLYFFNGHDTWYFWIEDLCDCSA